jgi:hypothetical protein
MESMLSSGAVSCGELRCRGKKQAHNSAAQHGEHAE